MLAAIAKAGALRRTAAASTASRALFATSAPGSAAAANEEERPKFSVVRHPVTTDAIKPEDYFAVIKLGGTQYKVTQVGSAVPSKCILLYCTACDI